MKSWRIFCINFDKRFLVMVFSDHLVIFWRPKVSILIAWSWPTSIRLVTDSLQVQVCEKTKSDLINCWMPITRVLLIIQILINTPRWHSNISPPVTFPTIITGITFHGQEYVIKSFWICQMNFKIFQIFLCWNKIASDWLRARSNRIRAVSSSFDSFLRRKDD